MENIYQLLDTIRSTTNVSALNKSAQLPVGTIAKHYMWRDGKAKGIAFPKQHVRSLLYTLFLIHGPVRLGHRLVIFYPEEEQSSVPCSMAEKELIPSAIDDWGEFILKWC